MCCFLLYSIVWVRVKGYGVRVWLRPSSTEWVFCNCVWAGHFGWKPQKWKWKQISEATSSLHLAIFCKEFVIPLNNDTQFQLEHCDLWLYIRRLFYIPAPGSLHSLNEQERDKFPPNVFEYPRNMCPKFASLVLYWCITAHIANIGLSLCLG